MSPERKEQTEKEMRTVKIITVVILCLVAGNFGFTFFKRAFDRSRELENMQATIAEYEEKISSEFPAYCSGIDLSVSGSYTAKGSAQLDLFDGSKKIQFYTITPNCSVTLHTDASFDRLKDRERYNILNELNEQAERTYVVFLEENMPVFADYTHVEPTPDIQISYKTCRPDVYIQTQDHLYQYSRMYDDLYVLDGESYFLMDEGSRWNRETKEYSNHSYDSHYHYGGSDNYGGYYSDADDYADEHYEEYMEEGMDFDDAYDAAYDDWE